LVPRDRNVMIENSTKDPEMQGPDWLARLRLKPPRSCADAAFGPLV
jgi:hypothetical protein